jgi:hypothetical protein
MLLKVLKFEVTMRLISVCQLLPVLYGCWNQVQFACVFGAFEPLCLIVKHAVVSFQR